MPNQKSFSLSRNCLKDACGRCQKDPSDMICDYSASVRDYIAGDVSEIFFLQYVSLAKSVLFQQSAF
ncbi:hypothetical protein AKJ16_DCAP23666 [Drosera capensis]